MMVTVGNRALIVRNWIGNAATVDIPARLTAVRYSPSPRTLQNKG